MYEISVGVNNARFRCLRQTSLSRQEDFLIQVAVLVRSLCFLFFFSFFLPALGVNGITLVPACKRICVHVYIHNTLKDFKIAKK